MKKILVFICVGILEFGNIGSTAAALNQTTQFATKLETVDKTVLSLAVENYVTAIETTRKAGKPIADKYDRLYRWQKVQRLNLTPSTKGKLFANIFGIGGLYYSTFTDAKLLLKLQSIEDLSKVKAFFEKIGPRGLNLSADAKLALQGDLVASDAFLNGMVENPIWSIYGNCWVLIGRNGEQI